MCETVSEVVSMASTSSSLSFSSSILPSPIPHAKSNPVTQNPIFRVTHFSISAQASKAAASSSSVSKHRKHRKETEFPQELFFENMLEKPKKMKKEKKKVKKQSNLKAWAYTLTEALSDCIHQNQWLKALELFDMVREEPYYQPREATYMKLIVLLGKSGQPHRAHQLFDIIKEDGCESTKLYTALIAAYCQNNLVDGALLILDEMKNLPQCQPDVLTYSTLIKAHLDALKFELVELLFEEMAERSITPDTSTRNIVLSGYGKAGRFDEMEKMLSSMMESSTCKPDVWTMNTVVSVFGSKGLIDMMEKWYEKLCNFGILPETHAFNILLGAYGKKRLYDKMSSVMQHMRKVQCRWTTSTYNNLIEAFADIGDAESMERTFDQMCSEGLKPDTKTFCCLINGYGNAGIFHKVVSSFNLAGKHKIRENTSFYNTVISACAKEEALMEMERVFERMKEKQCQPDETTYSIMIEAYRKEGMNDKVYYLEQEKQMMISDGKRSSEPEEAIHG